MNNISINTIIKFREIFICNDTEEYYGQYCPDSIDETKQKEVGKYSTSFGYITDEHIKKHLEGKIGLGVVPIFAENKSKFGVIDIDEYDFKKIKYILDLIHLYNMPLFPFKSKSGGLHIYIFFKNIVTSKYVRDSLTHFAKLFGLHKKTEIYPKQVSLQDKNGSWINLPYFSQDKRYLYNKEKNAYNIFEALDLIEKNKITKGDLENYFEALPINDAPPCLQILYMHNNTVFRNNYLFSLAVYYKSKYGDDFEDHLVSANSKLNDPLSIEELAKTLISSHKKKNYSYKCNEPPIIELCNKAECKKRKYGIGSGHISELSFEELIQYMSDPPHYGWKINNKELKFFREVDIINQIAFRELCFRELHILPAKLPDIKWTEIVNTATKNIVIQEIDPEDDISPGQMLKDYLVEFFEGRALARNKEQILMDKVYKDTEHSSYIFKAKNLLAFLIYQRQFRYFGQTEIQDRLRKMGGSPLKYYISKDIGTVRVWALPFSSLKKFSHKKVSYTEEFKLEELYNKEEF